MKELSGQRPDFSFITRNEVKEYHKYIKNIDINYYLNNDISIYSLDIITRKIKNE